MRAATYTAFGSAEDVLRIKDLERPSVRKGEVAVALAYSGVNPSDVKVRAGARPGQTKPPFPVICPHSEGAGTITEVGEGVDESRVGQRVWIWNGQWQRPMGTAAEEIVLPEEQAVALPASVSLESGACLGIVGLTAAHTVLGDGDVAGQTLLIHGGNGSVGHLAVQIAKWAGAKVISTSSPSGFDRCLAAGADAVLDYRSDTLAQDILERTNGDFVSRIVDLEFGKNIANNSEVIAPCGTIAVYGSAKDMTPKFAFGPLLFKAVTIDISLIYILDPKLRQSAIDNLHKALSERALSCPVDEVFALSETAAAHRAVETGGRSGAILVDPRR